MVQPDVPFTQVFVYNNSYLLWRTSVTKIMIEGVFI